MPNYYKLTSSLFFLLICSSIYGTTFYVSKSGNNSNAGTSANPWLTIQHGVNQINYGDSLFILSGNYQEAIWLGFNGNTANPTDYVYLIGNGQVILDGNNSLNSAFSTYYSSYIHLENLSFRNYTDHGVAFDGKVNLTDYGTPIHHIRIKNLNGNDNGNSIWKYGIFIRNAENFIIEGCNIVDSEWSNISIEESQYGGILNCYVSHEGNKVYKDDADGIVVQNSQYIRVANCIANYCHEDGIDIGGHSTGDIAHISVYNCIAMNCYSNGFPFSVTNDNSFDGYDITFAKCLSINNDESGFIAYQQPDDVRFIHNTSSNSLHGMHLRPENPQNIQMRNNIFAGNTINFTHNNIPASTFSLDNTNWGTNPPPTNYQGTNPQILDPVFVNPSADIYTLSANSPCIDAAGDLTNTTSAGSGTTIPVVYSKYFCDGFGIVSGDSINVGGQKALITSIPNSTTIVVADPISWSNNSPVNFLFNGNAPDLGYKETGTTTPNCNIITIYAAGDTNLEDMELYLGGEKVATWYDIGGNFNNQTYQAYSYTHCAPVSFECLTVALVEGGVINGLDYNLSVDNVSINNTTKETEAPDVFGAGLYINGCTSGYFQTDKLYCDNAFFTYGMLDADQDGICDPSDSCPGFDDKLIGASCDDNDPTTINDRYTSNCLCEGTTNCTIGQSCDDNDPCTINDQITDNICSCAGTYQNAGQGNPACNFLNADIRVCLEGVYDLNTNTMSTFLWQADLLPNGQPYAFSPWNYAGTEGQGWGKSNYPSTTVDWVLVSFRTGISKGSEVHQTAALLLEDGHLYFPNQRILDSNLGSAFYIFIQHRNHMGILSSQAISPVNGTITIDFCVMNSMTTNGLGQKELSPGQWVMYAGDGDQTSDIGFDVNGQDYASWSIQNGLFDLYSSFDFNLDSDINAQDRILWSKNNGVYSQIER